MRMGKTPKTRGWPPASAEEQPQHITSVTRIGQVSADLMKTYFQPKIITVIADQTLEQYAADWLSYQDALAAAASNVRGEDDTEVQVGLEEQPPLLPLPPPKPLFHSQASRDELDELLTAISDHFFAPKKAGWRVHSNAAKFERTLDEKYGVFRPFVRDHPEIEHVLRSLQRKYAVGYFSPLRQGPPPIPRGTAIILLFLLQRGKVRWDVLCFSALYLLIGLQPWALVAIVCIVQGVLERRRYTPVGAMPRHVPATTTRKDTTQKRNDDDDDTVRLLLQQPVGEPLDESNKSIEDTSPYDTLVVGTGCSTLYAAALLSRAGRKVLVLSSAEDASGCVTLDPDLLSADQQKEQWRNVPFDMDNASVTKVAGQQTLLAPALATTDDAQGGIRFAQIGSAADGYAHTILSVPGLGDPFVLKSGGAMSLMEDAAMALGDNFPPTDGTPGDSLTGQYLQACRTMNQGAGYFYLSKLLPESVRKLRSSSSPDDNTYTTAAQRACAALLQSCFPQHPALRSLLAAIGMVGENLVPSQTSMAAHISNVCSMTDNGGMHYPIGGPRALCHALANTIQQCGGKVVTKATVVEWLFDEAEESIVRGRSSSSSSGGNGNSDEAPPPPPPYCVGLQLRDGRKIRFAADRYSGINNNKKNSIQPAVVSMDGFIATFIRYLPDDIRTKYKVPRGLPALSERRPVLHFLFGLRGSAEELEVTGADYYRLPSAAVPTDHVDAETGTVTFGDIGWSDNNTGGDERPDDTTSAIAGVEDDQVVTATNNDSKVRKKGRNHFTTGKSWMRISFPSAKDPSFRERHGDCTTCVVTIEADDDIVTLYDTKPRIFAVKRAAAVRSSLQRAASTIQQDLIAAFPQLEGKVEHAELRGPYLMGLSNNPERYAAPGIRADSPYPGLYAGGSDLTVGHSFSGGTVGAWLVANAVCGYNAIDHLVLQKNITTDLERFLEAPSPSEVERVAVPFTQNGAL